MAILIIKGVKASPKYSLKESALNSFLNPLLWRGQGEATPIRAQKYPL